MSRDSGLLHLLRCLASRLTFRCIARYLKTSVGYHLLIPALFVLITFQTPGVICCFSFSNTVFLNPVLRDPQIVPVFAPSQLPCTIYGSPWARLDNTDIMHIGLFTALANIIVVLLLTWFNLFASIHTGHGAWQWHQETRQNYFYKPLLAKACGFRAGGGLADSVFDTLWWPHHEW